MQSMRSAPVIFGVCLGLGWPGLVATSFGGSPETANPLAAALLKAAQQAVAAVRETHYQHATQVRVDEGIYDLDCSGFVDYLLKQVAPSQYRALPVESDQPRPRARMFFDLAQQAGEHPIPGWSALRSMQQIQPGDLIVWELPEIPHRDTGHVMIASSRRSKNADGSCAVQVIDSSEIAHDADTRGEGQTGVGRGSITFFTDQEDRPVAFRFNAKGHVHFQPIALLRLMPLNDGATATPAPPK